MAEPVHRYIPCVDLRGNNILWQRRLTATPRYPFFCTTTETVKWFSAQQAHDMGLIKVAYVHESR